MAGRTVLGAFLTDLDSRAAIKGSRDPLGCQPIWTRFGRHVIGNLTTVSVSPHDFTVTLVGFRLLAQTRELVGAERDLACFLKWEQLCAYARASVNADWSFRGTETVRKRLVPGRPLRLSERGEDQILSNQKIYGLWGLYTAPSRASGLLEGDLPRLSSAADRFVDETAMPLLGDRDLNRIRRLLVDERPELRPEGDDRGVLERVASLLHRKFLRRAADFYDRHLVSGIDPDLTRGRQARLAEAVGGLPEGDGPDWFDAMRELERRCEREGWRDLGAHLGRIQVVESVLAPASRLFAHVLARDGRTIDSIADEIGRAWPREHGRVEVSLLGEIEGELEQSLPGSGARWRELGRAIDRAEYASAIELAIEQNAAVMAARGGAGWVEAAADGIRVRYDDRPQPLPDRAALRRLWVFPYFIPSLHSMARMITGARGG